VEFLEKQFTDAKNNKSQALLPANLEKETTSAQVNVMAKVNVDCLAVSPFGLLTPK